jgi:hypothetical protein
MPLAAYLAVGGGGGNIYDELSFLTFSGSMK